MRGGKITGWGIELKGYNMPNTKQFQLSQMHIVTVVIGGFVIGRGSGYALWKYPRDLFLVTVVGTNLPEAPAETFLADIDR